MALTPPIGTSGIFTLANPFQNVLKTNAVYTVMAVRRLADIIQDGLDPYVTFYTPYGLTQDQYNTDLTVQACIVSFQSTAGDWVHVPDAYIASYPDMNGVPYTSVVLGVALGPIPDHLNLASIKQRILDDVRDYIGITSTIMAVQVSATKLIAQSTSTSIEATRVAAIATSTTDRAKLLAAQATVTAQAAKITQLENYIKAHLPPTSP